MGYTKGTNLNNDGLVLLMDLRNPKSYNGQTSSILNRKRNGIKAVINNSPTYSNSSKLQFDGVDDYITIPQNSEFEVQNFTINLWFKIGDLSTNTVILSYGPGSSNLNKGIILWNQGTTIRFAINTYNSNTSNYTFNDTSNYYNWTLTYDGSNLKIYVNGSLVATQPETSTVDYSDSIGWGIGAFPNGIYQSSIDFYNFQFYQRALTEKEIAINFNALKNGIGKSIDEYVPPASPSPSPSPAPTSNIVTTDLGWWYDEDTLSGTTWTDKATYSGYDNNPTEFIFYNGAAESTSTDGVKSVYFDGVNDRAAISTSSTAGWRWSDIAAANTGFTIELWIRSNGNWLNNGQIWSAYMNSGMRMRTTSSGTLWYPYIKGGSAHSVGNLPINEWIHLATTYDDNGSTGSLKTYINGTLIKTQSSGWAPDSWFGATFFAMYNSTSEANRFWMSTTRMYHRPLTASEVLQNYEDEKTHHGHV